MMNNMGLAKLTIAATEESSLQTESTTSAQHDQALADYFSHINTMSLIRQLQPLLIAIQQHRGATMAFLAGSKSFEPKIICLEQEIKNRCQRIKQLNAAYSLPISKDQWLEYESEYDALMGHWREDTVIANFEFHCHFIDLIIQLMQKLAMPAIAYTTNRTNLKVSTERTHLAKMILKDVPQLIESIAKIRGIVTHATVCGQSNVDMRTKVKYLLQSITQYQEELRATLQILQQEDLKISQAFLQSMLHEHKITQLSQLIKEEFLEKNHITAESHSMFEFITNIIDCYSNLFEQGINHIQHTIDKTFALTPR